MHLGLQQLPLSEEIHEYILVEIPQRTLSRYGTKAWQPVKDLLRKCADEYLRKHGIDESDVNPAKVELYSGYFASCRMFNRKWAKPCYGQSCYELLIPKGLEGLKFNAWYGKANPGQPFSWLDGPKDPKTGQILSVHERLAARVQAAQNVPGWTMIPQTATHPPPSIQPLEAFRFPLQAVSNQPTNRSLDWPSDEYMNADIHVFTPVSNVLSLPSSRSSSVSAGSSALSSSTEVSSFFNAHWSTNQMPPATTPPQHGRHGCSASKIGQMITPTAKVYYKPPKTIEFRGIPITTGSQDICNVLEHLYHIHKHDFSITSGPNHKGKRPFTVKFQSEYLAKSLLKALNSPGLMIGAMIVEVAPNFTNRRCLNEVLHYDEEIFHDEEASATKSEKRRKGPVIVDGSVSSDDSVKG